LKNIFLIIFWLVVLSSITLTTYKALNTDCNDIPNNDGTNKAETIDNDGGKVSTVKNAIKAINNFATSKLNRCS
jgi:hypothetical protein